MSKQARRIGKKKIIILVVSAGLILLAAAYFGYMFYHQLTIQAPPNDKMKEEVKQLNISGEQDIATQYIAALKANQSEKAQQLFVAKVAAEKDVQKKIDLFTQNVQLALSYQKTDEALDAAKRAIEVRPSHDVYMQVATVYVARHDTANQIVYLKKALDALNGSNDPKKATLKSYYQQQLDIANEQLALRKKHGW